jgi:hypothetical protein
MADQQFLRSFGFERSREGSAVVESGGSLQRIATGGEQETLRKTVWQESRTPPLLPGDTFTVDGTLGTCTRISVSDVVVSIEGKEPRRLWKIDIEGFVGGPGSPADLEAAEGQYFEEHGVEAARRETALIEGSGGLSVRNAGPERKELTKTVWQSDSTPPVSPGGVFSFNGVSGIVERVSVSDEVVSLSGGVPTRLWRFSIEGVAGSPGGDEELNGAARKFFETSEISEAISDGIEYEGLDGSRETVRLPGNSRKVSKTTWQSDAIPPVAVGGSFTVSGISVVCTNVSISDEVLTIEGGVPVRLYRVDLEGVEGASGIPTRFQRERSISRKLNGTVETALDGETVILKRSTSPVTTVSITCYSGTETPPVAVGDVYDGGIVTGVDTVRTVVDVGGMRVAELWRHSLEVAR